MLSRSWCCARSSQGPRARADVRQDQEWSFESRAALSGPLERFQEGLIEAWEEHARLTPTPEVLRTLGRLYVEQRDELVRLYSAGRLMHEGAFEGVRNTAIAIAGVYLRQSDVSAAISHVQSLGSLAGNEARFTEMLEASQEESSDGALALLELIQIYYEGGALDVANGIALAGLRQRPYEPALRCAWAGSPPNWRLRGCDGLVRRSSAARAG